MMTRQGNNQAAYDRVLSHLQVFGFPDSRQSASNPIPFQETLPRLWKAAQRDPLLKRMLEVASSQTWYVWRGAAPTLRVDPIKEDRKGWTALHRALEANQERLVEALIKCENGLQAAAPEQLATQLIQYAQRQAGGYERLEESARQKAHDSRHSRLSSNRRWVQVYIFKVWLKLQLPPHSWKRVEASKALYRYFCVEKFAQLEPMGRARIYQDGPQEYDSHGGDHPCLESGEPDFDALMGRLRREVLRLPGKGEIPPELAEKIDRLGLPYQLSEPRLSRR
jgi:hypothetical protein